MRLKDKVAFITGGGSGLGRESARLFAEEGAKVVVFDLQGGRAAETEKIVREEGGTVLAIEGDVTKEEDLERAVAETLSSFGRLDVMFANAGMVSRGGVPGVLGGEHIPLEDYPLEDWNAVVNVNLTGVFLTCKHAIRPMRDNGGGSIVVTSSSASFAAYPNITPYTATKAGVNGMVRNLSFDLGKYGIRVNALAPAHGMSPNFLMPPDSAVVGKSYEEAAGDWDPFAKPMPLKLTRPPSLRDNAKVALFLASDDSAYMSGVCLPATDGGTLARVAIQFEGDVARDHGAWRQDAD
ncbi:SDR family NAD(P)-dependent oxidoreductase [Actinocorallia aurantiaca]|uniref:SDR family oxidoreductase n=1 Tax=Actinocorallia aurantiaca TaxID=46204 RepID=A0ABN3UPA1_9ACTN